MEYVILKQIKSDSFIRIHVLETLQTWKQL